MVRISCPGCDKTFRKQTGLAWHLERTHQPVLESLDENSDAFADGGGARIEAIQTRLETLEERVDALGDLSEGLNSLSDLRDQVVSIQEQFGDLRQVHDRQQQEQGLRDQALEHQLAEAQELGRKGAKAQSNVLALATFLKDDLLPAMAAHSNERLITIYRDQETIDKLPKCTFCGSPKKDSRRTCGQLECVARVLSIPQTTHDQGQREQRMCLLKRSINPNGRMGP